MAGALLGISVSIVLFRPCISSIREHVSIFRRIDKTNRLTLLAHTCGVISSNTQSMALPLAVTTVLIWIFNKTVNV